MSIATYYAPSTASSVITSWIPLTTVYGNHGAACATQIRGFSDSFWAWYPDDILFSFSSSCLPIEVTAWVNQEYPYSTVLSIGPFAGCPDAYTLATSYTTDPVSGLTICCPRYVRVYPAARSARGLSLHHQIIFPLHLPRGDFYRMRFPVYIRPGGHIRI